jgi:hypothetical protein
MVNNVSNGSNGSTEQPKSDPPSPDYAISATLRVFIFGVPSIILLGWVLKTLLFGPFPGHQVLLLMYGSLFLLVLYVIHILFVILPRKWNVVYRKNTPKYIEYVSLALVSLGLLQILTFPPKLSSYIISISGDKDAILDRIKANAIRLKERCIKEPNEYLTENYCSKVTEIANSSHLGDTFRSKFLDDTDLHDSIIGDRPVPWYFIFRYDPDWGTERRIFIKSPFATDMDNYRALLDYKKYKLDQGWESVLSWALMLALPFGIAIRILKTSIELFVTLK